MKYNSPLDDPIPDPERFRKSKLVKTLFTVEALLWCGRFVAAFLIMESVQGGSELVILSSLILAILYMVVPHLLMASKSRWERIGSFGVGFSLAFALLMRMLYFASWPGAAELAHITFPLVGIVGIGILFFLIAKPSSWSEAPFYKHALIRLLLAAWFSIGAFLNVI
jgi:hypothetical protein